MHWTAEITVSRDTGDASGDDPGRASALAGHGVWVGGSWLTEPCDCRFIAPTKK